jgi:hypothetical protein
MVSLTRFSNKKFLKMVGIRKPPYQFGQINLDPIILTSSVINKMINNLIMNHLIGLNLYLN